MKKSTNTTARKGRVALKMRKGADLQTQGQEGGRCRRAYHAMMLLNMVSKLPPKPPDEIKTVIDWFVPMLVKAWKSNDVEFFKGITDTVKRNRQQSTNEIAADVEASKLFNYRLTTPRQYWESKVFSIIAIQNICGGQISARKAAELAKLAGLKTRGKGRPNNSAHKV
jgi:hypothetical protein